MRFLVGRVRCRRSDSLTCNHPTYSKGCRKSTKCIRKLSSSSDQVHSISCGMSVVSFRLIIVIVFSLIVFCCCVDWDAYVGCAIVVARRSSRRARIAWQWRRGQRGGGGCNGGDADRPITGATWSVRPRN